MDLGKNTSALELFDRALKSNAREPLALYGKGMLLAEEPITQEIALSMLKASVQESDLGDKLKARAYLRLSEIYAARDDKEDAIQYLAKISGTGRLIDGQGMRRLAEIYLKLKEKDRAREALTAYLETHPQDEETEYFLLKLYILQLKDSKAGAKLCSKLDAGNSRLPKYLLNCSRLLASVNEYTTALSLVDLYLKKSSQPSAQTKEADELRDAIAKKRGKFQLSESDF